MRNQYLRCPVGFGDNLYVVSYQSLFVVKNHELYGLCDFKSEVKDIKISTDGSALSFFSREDSNGDIYLYKIGSSSLSRITYFDDPALINVLLNDDSVVVSSNAFSPSRARFLYEINVESKNIQKLTYADAHSISKSGHKTIIQRFGNGYHAWRGYKGGTAGRLYLHEPNKEPIELPFPENNAYLPIFVGDRLFFLSDVDSGVPNLYEYFIAKNKYEQKTFHTDFCVRDISAWGSKILYSCGGKIYAYNLKSDKSELIEINGGDYSCTDSAYTLQNPIEYLTSLTVNDKGKQVGLAARGHVFNYNIGDKVFRQSNEDIRYRLALFLSDTTLLQIKDKDDASIFEIYDLEESEVKSAKEFEVGHVRYVHKIDNNKVVVQNHKAALIIVDLENDKLTHVARGKFNRIAGFDVSPDGKWIAYSMLYDVNVKSKATLNSIYLYNIELGESYKVSSGNDEYAPSFSKDGKYLYFLSDLELKTKYDSFYFNLYFPPNTSICALCLNKNVEHPFKPWLSENKVEEKEEDKEDKEENTEEQAKTAKKVEKKVEYPEIVIDEIVCVRSELAAGNYSGLISLSESKLLVISHDDESHCNLQLADLTNNTFTVLMNQIESLGISNNREWIAVSNSEKIRVGKAAEQFDDNDKTYRDGGWISLANLNLTIDPKAEWKRILFESWWLLKERFWHKKMNNLDWPKVFEKYESLLPSLRSREDLNLVLEELMGENGTSHNFIYDRGDDDLTRHPKQGYLAAKFDWEKGYKIREIDNVRDFDGFRLTPLLEPGVKISIGDTIIEIDGVKCKEGVPIEHYLQYKANKKIVLTYVRNGKKHNTVVQPLGSPQKLKYRQWVSENRDYVHEKTENKIGYLHIPDMGPEGFREFHRFYNQERNYDGIIIDVRNNNGGHVSSLIMKILFNIQTGFDVSQDQFHPYPEYSNKGKFVLLCNEYCGSDGDVFTYMFRKYAMGEIIGRRTWGGVVGIDPSGKYRFIDRGFFVQPGFALVQSDVGLSIENKGVEPDFDIKTPPLTMSDWPENDPQLNKGIEVIMNKIDKNDLEEETFKKIYGE